jgi:hypothetical protein
MPKLQKIFILLLLLSVFYSCNFMRAVYYNAPSTSDHKKAFVCDTMACYPAAEKDKLIRAERALPNLETWVPLAQRMGTTEVEQFLKKSKTTAFIVVKEDSLLYEEYFNGATADQAKTSFSIHKSLIAMLVAIAQEEGKLNINQRVADFIPEFGEDERKGIRLHHLMNMVSGTAWHDKVSVLGLGLLYYNKNQDDFWMKHSELKYEPGTHYYYNSMSTQILGECLERAVGKSSTAYMEEKLWKPLHIADPAYVTLDSKKNAQTRMFGGMAITPRSMLRIGQLLLNEGYWEGKQILPPWFVKQISSRKPNFYQWGYIYCFKHRGYETSNFNRNRYFYAEGYKGQFIFVDLDEKMLVIRQGDDDPCIWPVLFGRLIKQMTGNQTDLTDPKLDYGDQMAGRYLDEDGVEMQLKLMPKRDKYGRRQWLWERPDSLFPHQKKYKSLFQIDGVSMGKMMPSQTIRLYMDIDKGKVKGLYAYRPPLTKGLYFRKEMLD